MGEFALADTQGVIPINPTTGIGQIGGNEVGDGIVNPRIQPINDTDLFTFVTHAAGDFALSVLPFTTGIGRIAPRVTLFDANGVVLQTLPPRRAVRNASSTSPTRWPAHASTCSSRLARVSSATPQGDTESRSPAPPSAAAVIPR